MKNSSSEKMQIFRSLTDRHTLLIVDNFDVDGDPDLKLFLEGAIGFFYYQKRSPGPGSRISVKAIPDPEALFTFLRRIMGCLWRRKTDLAGTVVSKGGVSYLYD